MGGWDHVFSTGEHTDSNGNKKVWTVEDLDRIVSTFKPSFHEPPVVIGHPDDKAPAWGWVEGIKRIGNDLFVKYRDMETQFQEWVKAGRYRKRSISLYPDGSLRHVGFLGAAPPAIKGLPDFAFADGDRKVETYEFADLDDMTVARLFRRLRDFIIAQFGLDKADQVIPDYEVTGLQIEASMPDDDEQGLMPAYSEKESDMKQEEVQALIDTALKGQAATFSEQLKKAGEENASLKKNLEGLRKQIGDGDEAAARREFTVFCEGLTTRIAPASIPAIVGHMMTLRTAEPVEFDDGQGGKTKRSQLEIYRDSLGKLPETVQLGEFASGANAGERQIEMDAVELSRKAQEFQESEAKAGRTVTIADAVYHVQKEARKGGAN